MCPFRKRNWIEPFWVVQQQPHTQYIQWLWCHFGGRRWFGNAWKMAWQHLNAKLFNKTIFNFTKFHLAQFECVRAIESKSGMRWLRAFLILATHNSSGYRLRSRLFDCTSNLYRSIRLFVCLSCYLGATAHSIIERATSNTHTDIYIAQRTSLGVH